MANPALKSNKSARKVGYQLKTNDVHREHEMFSSKPDKPIDIGEQCKYLTNVADVIVPQFESCRDEMVKCERLRQQLLKVCIQVSEEASMQSSLPTASLKTTLHCIGSLRSCTALRGSDVDLLLKVTTSNDASLTEMLGIPRRLQKALILKGYAAKLVTTSRVPVLRICTQATEELLSALLQDTKQWEAYEQVCKVAGSDAELLRLFRLALRDGKYNSKDKEIIRNFEAAIAKSDGNINDPALCKARASLKMLPRVIERYARPNVIYDTELPPRGIGIHCDITFGEDMTRHTAQLVRCYMRCDKRLREMIIFVKAWAQLRQINRAYHGTLGSYGYVLMVLHYAVNVASPPLCPNLQHELGGLRGGAPNVPRTCQGYNIQFWRNEKQIELAVERGMLTYNQQKIGALLRGFYAYYAAFTTGSKGFNWNHSVISLRSKDGIVSKRDKGWTSAHNETSVAVGANPTGPVIRHRYLLAIEEPFQTDLNVGRSVTYSGVCAIRDEFRRAHRLIQHGGLSGGLAIDFMAKDDLDITSASQSLHNKRVERKSATRKV